MAKIKFVGEYGFKASKKILFPYIATPSGLARWFASEVIGNNKDKIYTFVWDGEENRAKMVAMRSNHHVRFEFLDDDEDPNYLEMVFDTNELTQEVFLKVTDYSEMDVEEARELWEGLIHDLKEIVGA